MKIAYVVRRYSRAEWGGIESVVMNAVACQRARGDDVKIFCTNALQPPEGSTEAETFPYFYPYFPLTAANRAALDKKGGNPFAPGLLKAVRAYGPDVIHVYAGGRLACQSIRLAQELGVPSVMSLQGGAVAVPQKEMANMLSPLRHTFPYGGVLDRLLGIHFDPLARISAIVTCSREERDLIQRRFPSQLVRYLPNGVVPKIYAHRPFEQARKVLCLSRLDYQKNQMALVELLARRPELTVRLVGPVTVTWYRDSLLARAQELGVAGRLTIDPALKPDSPEFHAAFADADVFVLPSAHEPFGIVALEAMQHGIPLVSSAVGGLVDFVHDGENGLLFDPNEPATLDAAFDRLTPALAEKVSAGGLKTVAEYGWPTLVEKLAQIYEEARGR